MEIIATILMLVGVIAPLVGLVMLVTSLIKKRTKKKPLIILLAGILCFIIGGIMMPTEPATEPEVQNPTANESISIAKIIKNAVLQYPASNENFKYNVYDTYIEITEYIGSQEATSITVPAKLENLPVYVVDHRVFDMCKVPTIIFEDGIYNIKCGFSSSLVSVTLPSTLDYIGGYQFKNCYALKNVVIPEGIDSIQVGAFESCSKLKEITIPSTVKEISTGVFAYCTSLEKVNLSNGMKTIGEKAFVQCKNLKSIDIPDTVETIKFNAFQGSGLVSVEIPASVTKIGASAFLACESLKEVKVHNSDVTIEPQTYESNGVAMGTHTTLFGQCNKDLVVYGKPASAIARTCAEENVYFEAF